ncbi:recombination protein NinG [Roseococcus sp.]|uniref:recombination protein NinG n=1 Tax=Roseococcus sp. TaxID=2109646 RepID=UPI003BA8CA08
MVVRERDNLRYGGKCVSCPHRFTDWRVGHDGHWLPRSVCHSWFKFDVTNIALQCKSCNVGLTFSAAHIGHAMGEELKRRYGDNVLARIQRDNRTFRGQKMEVWEIVARAEDLVRQ